jgi:hypothetical protein
MDDESREPGDLAGELRTLGKNLRDLFRSAWDSEDRKRLQEEIEGGVADLTDSLRSAAKDFSQSETGRQLQEDVRDLGERVRSGEVESKVRQDLTEVLRRVNEELGRTAKDWVNRPPQEPEDKS